MLKHIPDTCIKAEGGRLRAEGKTYSLTSGGRRKAIGGRKETYCLKSGGGRKAAGRKGNPTA